MRELDSNIDHAVAGEAEGEWQIVDSRGRDMTEELSRRHPSRINSPRFEDDS
jgi:hypothetical protein